MSFSCAPARKTTVVPVAVPVASSRHAWQARCSRAFRPGVQTTLWPCQTNHLVGSLAPGGRL